MKEIVWAGIETIADKRKAANSVARYYPAFDYLRFCLSIAVATTHAGLLPWEQAGNLAVQVFFALSGWLIGGILLESKPGDFPRFYFNRSARIWIPYFLAITLLVGASLLKESVTPKWVEFVTYKLTFVYDFFGPPQISTYGDLMPLRGTGNHFWSICAEEQFYLLAPALMLLPVGRSPLLWLAIFVAAMKFEWNLFGAISLGVFAATVKRRLGDWHLDRRAAAPLWVASLGLFAVVYLSALPYRFVAPLFGTSVVLCLARPGPQSRFGEFIGGMSYPLYLNHWIGIFIAHALFPKWRGSTLVESTGVVLSVLVAAALYFLIDRTVRHHRSRLYSPRRGVIAAGLGYSLVGAGLIYGLVIVG